MYARTLRKAEQTRRFSITEAGTDGWEVREEADSRLVRRTVYTDWHRVEREQMGIALAVRLLVHEGWTEAG